MALEDGSEGSEIEEELLGEPIDLKKSPFKHHKSFKSTGGKSRHGWLDKLKKVIKYKDGEAVRDQKEDKYT